MIIIRMVEVQGPKWLRAPPILLSFIVDELHEPNTHEHNRAQPSLTYNQRWPIILRLSVRLPSVPVCKSPGVGSRSYQRKHRRRVAGTDWNTSASRPPRNRRHLT